MVRNPVARATGAALYATLVVLVIVAGLGNQALANWRLTQASSSNGWVSDIFRPLEQTGWRFNPATGESTSQWLAPLVFNVALLILTFLLVDIAARDAGRLSLFYGTWSAVTLAAGAAGLISTQLRYQGVGSPASQNYAATLTEGLVFGFLVGFIAAIVASLFAGPRAARFARDSETVV